MALRCAACGKLSRDEIVCEYCRQELGGVPPELPPPHCPLPPRRVTLTLPQSRLLSQPEHYLHLETEGGAWRVHWLGPTAWSQWRESIARRLKLALPCLAAGHFLEEADGAWLLFAAGTPLPVPWAGHDGTDALAELGRLLEFVRSLEQALETLHAQGLVWLNFDPLELELAHGGAHPLRFTNLDLRVFRRGELDPRARLRPHFVPPEVLRGHAHEISSATDVFHLGLFTYYWLGGLLPEGFPGLGLESFDYRIPPLRIYAPWIPPGLARVVNQALSPIPEQRFSRPAQFVLALEEIVTRLLHRIRHAGPIHWETGQHTRVGRTKAALGRENEDQVLVRPFSSPERVLLAVADGISTCEVGTGRLASWLTLNVLENAFTTSSNSRNFDERIIEVCHQSARALVQWAIEKGYENQLREGADLMGTTLTAGWIEGRHFHLANLGDSRAYLIDEHDVEQLTVDGDLASSLLGQGYPPESLLDLGPITRALRECIGGCQLDAEGRVAIIEELCTPSLFQLPLLPGDIVVLCTDGLVEEGMFLEPATLAHLVRTHRHRPAQEIAEILADAADALQRLPSPMEREGYGDNVSVIVVKIG